MGEGGGGGGGGVEKSRTEKPAPTARTTKQPEQQQADTSATPTPASAALDQPTPTPTPPPQGIPEGPTPSGGEAGEQETGENKGTPQPNKDGDFSDDALRHVEREMDIEELKLNTQLPKEE